jgi:hypothetical protein
MARPAYSSKLLDVTLSDGGTADIFALPLTVVVIRDVLLTCSEENGGDMTFALALGLDASLLFWNLPPAWSGTMHWAGRQVLEPGDTATASWADSLASQTCHVEISGYVLTTT